MEYRVEKGNNNTYKIDVTVELFRVDAAFKEALEHEAENADIKGFRKGKAPLNVVKEHVDAAHLRSHALNHLLTEVYSKIITENKLSPIVYPRFEIKEFEEGKDLKFVMTIIERPEIKIGDYKSTLEKFGKDKRAEPKEENHGESVLPGVTNQDIMKLILEVSEISIPEELVTEEVDRMMSSLIDQTGRMGLTIDQYLESQKKTPDELRAIYKKSAEENIKADFIITEIADLESISVDDAEIEHTINAIPDEASKKALQSPEQRMYIKAILIKNKTLQKLAEYAVEKNADSSKEDKK